MGICRDYLRHFCHSFFISRLWSYLKLIISLFVPTKIHWNVRKVNKILFGMSVEKSLCWVKIVQWGTGGIMFFSTGFNQIEAFVHGFWKTCWLRKRHVWIKELRNEKTAEPNDNSSKKGNNKMKYGRRNEKITLKMKEYT